MTKERDKAIAALREDLESVLGPDDEEVAGWLLLAIAGILLILPTWFVAFALVFGRHIGG